jgi:Fic family protein
LKPDKELQQFEHQLAWLAKARENWVEPGMAECRTRRVHSAWCNAAIEGNPLSWKAALELTEGRKPPESRHDLETLSCFRATEFLDMSPNSWNLALVRHLHAQVMEGLGARPGELREREVKIVKESGEGAGQTVFHPPHPARVGELLQKLMLETLEIDEDPLLAAGRFHYEFQSIHPFEDGNGRVGRLLTTALARRAWASAGFYLEPAIRRAGSAYYLALRAVRTDYEEVGEQGLMPWLLPFLNMAADAFTHPDPPEVDS